MPLYRATYSAHAQDNDTPKFSKMLELPDPDRELYIEAEDPKMLKLLYPAWSLQEVDSTSAPVIELTNEDRLQLQFVNRANELALCAPQFPLCFTKYDAAEAIYQGKDVDQVINEALAGQKVVYVENEDHQYSHVGEIDNEQHRFAEGQFLIQIVPKGFHRPSQYAAVAEWSFVDMNLEPAVYKGTPSEIESAHPQSSRSEIEEEAEPGQ